MQASSIQSAEAEVTMPYSRESAAEMADQPYGAPRQTCVANAGTNMDQRFVKEGGATAACGPRKRARPEGAGPGFSASFRRQGEAESGRDSREDRPAFRSERSDADGRALAQRSMARSTTLHR